MAVSWSNVVGAKTLVDGGYAGDLLELTLVHLQEARDNNQLTEALVGEVYASTIATALNAAINFELQKEIAAEQLLTNVAQTALITRQTKGFDDDAKQKLLKQALDSWSVAYSVAKDANSIPDAIKVNPIDSIMKNAMDNLSIVVTTNPIGEA